jgi:long-chain fatty acid transport protein
MKKLLTSLFLVFLAFNLNYGSGFQINEHGAKAMAMAGAFVGLANDASAVYFNPAALTFLNGTKISVGASFIRPSSTFTGPAPATTESELKARFFTPINFYITHKINDDLAVGLGVNNPFGLGTEWEEDWLGRYNAVQTEIRTFDITPVIAYKLSDQLSISVGARIMYADVLLTRALQLAVPANPALGLTQPIPMEDGKLELEGDDLAFSFNAAVFYKANKEWSFGLAYKHQVALEFEGDVVSTLSAIPSVIPAQAVPLVQAGLEAAVPTGKANAPLDAPSVILTGAAFQPNKELTVTADFQYTMWSSYDELRINFEEWQGGVSSVSVRDYEDSFIARLGAEYVMNEKFALRGGFLYDKNPVKDEYVDFTLPDADRIGLNIGFGYNLTESLSVDLAYLFLMFTEREITNSKETLSDATNPVPLNGKYESSAHLIGLNFNYNL